MLKKVLGIFALAAVLIGVALIVVFARKNAPKSGAREFVNSYVLKGKDTLENKVADEVLILGDGVLNNVQAKEIKVNGSAHLQKTTANEIMAHGALYCTDCLCKDTASVYGKIEAKKSNFKAIVVYGSEAVFEDSTVEELRVICPAKDLLGASLAPQEWAQVDLHGKSNIKRVVFEGREGKVVLHDATAKALSVLGGIAFRMMQPT